jgi:hypothetical protein
MKKILTILSCAVLFALSSCTKQYVTPGNTNQTVYANIATTDWTLYTDNNGSKSYTAPISVNFLSQGFVKSGAVAVAISYDNGNTFEELPETYDNIAYSYTYNAGNVSLYAQSSDGTTAVQPNLPIVAKITFISANN